MKCEKCGAEMVTSEKNGEILVECPNCGNSLATTVAPKIIEDKNEYRLILLPHQRIDKKTLRTVASIAGSNYIIAAKILADESKSLIVTGTALKIKRAARLLDEATLHYEIEPSFPYNLDDKSDDDYAI